MFAFLFCVLYELLSLHTLFSFWPSSFKRDFEEIKELTERLNSISSQDEFSKWAKLKRKVDLKQTQFNLKHKQSDIKRDFVYKIVEFIFGWSVIFFASDISIWHQIFGFQRISGWLWVLVLKLALKSIIK